MAIGQAPVSEGNLAAALGASDAIGGKPICVDNIAGIIPEITASQGFEDAVNALIDEYMSTTAYWMGTLRAERDGGSSSNARWETATASRAGGLNMECAASVTSTTRGSTAYFRFYVQPGRYEVDYDLGTTNYANAGAAFVAGTTPDGESVTEGKKTYTVSKQGELTFRTMDSHEMTGNYQHVDWAQASLSIKRVS